MSQFSILIEYTNSEPIVPFERLQLVQGQYEDDNKEWLDKLLTTLVAARILIPVDSNGIPLKPVRKRRKQHIT
jgi:hypothetical protein